MLQAAGAAIVVSATQSLRIPTSPPSAFRHLLVVECPPTVLLRSFVAADDLIVLVAVFVSERVAFTVVALLLCSSFVPLLLRRRRRRRRMVTTPRDPIRRGASTAVAAKSASPPPTRARCRTPPHRACLPRRARPTFSTWRARSSPRTAPRGDGIVGTHRTALSFPSRSWSPQFRGAVIYHLSLPFMSQSIVLFLR